MFFFFLCFFLSLFYSFYINFNCFFSFYPFLSLFPSVLSSFSFVIVSLYPHLFLFILITASHSTGCIRNILSAARTHPCPYIITVTFQSHSLWLVNFWVQKETGCRVCSAFFYNENQSFIKITLIIVEMPLAYKKIRRLN